MVCATLMFVWLRAHVKPFSLSCYTREVFMSLILAEAGPAAGVILAEAWHHGWRRDPLCSRVACGHVSHRLSCRGDFYVRFPCPSEWSWKCWRLLGGTSW